LIFKLYGAEVVIGRLRKRPAAISHATVVGAQHRETMLSERVKLSGEVAYLPWVKFTGTDNHFFGNSGALAEQFAEWGVGRGVQLEAIVSYYLTPQLSIGVGGRYWAMWTTDAATNCTYGAMGLCDATPTPPQFFRTVVEQAGVTVQASYKFNGSGALLTK